jgi:hypothetical protein
MGSFMVAQLGPSQQPVMTYGIVPNAVVVFPN